MVGVRETWNISSGERVRVILDIYISPWAKKCCREGGNKKKTSSPPSHSNEADQSFLFLAFEMFFHFLFLAFEMFFHLLRKDKLKIVAHKHRQFIETNPEHLYRPVFLVVRNIDRSVQHLRSVRVHQGLMVGPYIHEIHKNDDWDNALLIRSLWYSNLEIWVGDRPSKQIGWTKLADHDIACESMSYL